MCVCVCVCGLNESKNVWINVLRLGHCARARKKVLLLRIYGSSEIIGSSLLQVFCYIFATVRCDFLRNYKECDLDTDLICCVGISVKIPHRDKV